jgi:hypothetical protein
MVQLLGRASKKGRSIARSSGSLEPRPRHLQPSVCGGSSQQVSDGQINMTFTFTFELSLVTDCSA